MCSLGWSLGEENEQLGIEDSRTTTDDPPNSHQSKSEHENSQQINEKHPLIEKPMCVLLLDYGSLA